ncbi:MAG: SAM-dependent methyltransferase [Vulcanococcus sp.]|jgi:malonyl-CoA O-methyltransferase
MGFPDHATLSSGFTARVRQCFSHGAAGYERSARLQAAVAQRLANLAQRAIAAPLPAGPCADLGAGSGLLSRALGHGLGPALAGAPLLRLDNCTALLAEDHRHSPEAPQLLWDLNRGLPRQLQGAALLASNFCLQWLEQPAQHLDAWCRQLQSGGWLLLAVPTAGSFSIWHQAAATAAVPFSGLALPPAAPLLATCDQHLQVHHQRLLRFSRANPGGAAFLRQIKAIGAQASPQRRLGAGELRRLLAHWPGAEQPLQWEVLILLGRKP